ncbi:killer cell lectin-like receptor subfamily I member 1 [Diceros bicornis minor]|uniref:killer cell lectin-like receptor subfamily I member 1 n=1 Tax=Diceros bicornis minor TaxID=77932 RepID=UPI0026EBEEB5|nr:killer cell lectin-like receptor subfamily I member 1 [Diceros bicornis minor]
MLKNKQNEDIGKQHEVTYTELNFSKSPQKQRVPKTGQSNVISSEQQVTYMELKFPSSHLQHKKRFDRKKRKDHQSMAWQVTTGSLGVLCIILMTTVGVLLANLFSSREEENQKISLIPTLSSKNGECSCDLCPNHWIGFGNSCYHLSSEPKTWPESHAACAELNSHLLKIDVNEELKILSIFEMKGWVGLKINETNGSWLWEDGTKVIQSLLTFLKEKNHKCAYMVRKYIYTDDCSSRRSYICEFTI